MSDKTEKKAGALHSELRIELHTQYAINTWSGRPVSTGKPSLIGMPLFFRLISRINRDSLADNPWADAALVEVETLLETASQQLQKWLNDIDALMVMLPANASVSGVTSTAPLNIGVHSHTPLGYRCVYLLVGFDQLILRVLGSLLVSGVQAAEPDELALVMKQLDQVQAALERARVVAVQDGQNGRFYFDYLRAKQDINTHDEITRTQFVRGEETAGSCQHYIDAGIH
jgi:integrating conjugative element protein (TIGR03761 family)